MKKISFLFLLMIISFFIVGCGCNKKESNIDEVKEVSEIEKTINELYTDEEKLVYDNNGIYKIVIYYKGEKITKVEHYYEYKDENEAVIKYNEDINKYKDNAQIDKITKSGKFVVYSIANIEYKNKTVSEIQSDYSFLIPIYEK